MNYGELEAAIARSGISINDLAKALNCSPAALFNKRHGKSEFTASEIRAFAEATNTGYDGIGRIFFSEGVN